MNNFVKEDDSLKTINVEHEKYEDKFLNYRQRRKCKHYAI